ncbi:unnamed protein product [Amoebophrya sp. A25]|nr:unnamed protein product [Amoebophrya sp. A25]|eukprot:GSA25T00015356001.1
MLASSNTTTSKNLLSEEEDKQMTSDYILKSAAASDQASSDHESMAAKYLSAKTLFRAVLENRWFGIAHLMVEAGVPISAAVQDALSQQLLKLTCSLTPKAPTWADTSATLDFGLDICGGWRALVAPVPPNLSGITMKSCASDDEKSRVLSISATCPVCFSVCSGAVMRRRRAFDVSSEVVLDQFLQLLDAEEEAKRLKGVAGALARDAVGPWRTSYAKKNFDFYERKFFRVDPGEDVTTSSRLVRESRVLCAAPRLANEMITAEDHEPFAAKTSKPSSYSHSRKLLQQRLPKFVDIHYLDHGNVDRLLNISTDTVSKTKDRVWRIEKMKRSSESNQGNGKGRSSSRAPFLRAHLPPATELAYDFVECSECGTTVELDAAVETIKNLVYYSSPFVEEKMKKKVKVLMDGSYRVLGCTGLHVLATYSGDSHFGLDSAGVDFGVEIAERMMTGGCDPNGRNGLGMTALDTLVNKSGLAHKALFDFLLEKTSAAEIQRSYPFLVETFVMGLLRGRSDSVTAAQEDGRREDSSASKDGSSGDFCPSLSCASIQLVLGQLATKLGEGQQLEQVRLANMDDRFAFVFADLLTRGTAQHRSLLAQILRQFRFPPSVVREIFSPAVLRVVAGTRCLQAITQSLVHVKGGTSIKASKDNASAADAQEIVRDMFQLVLTTQMKCATSSEDDSAPLLALSVGRTSDSILSALVYDPDHGQQGSLHVKHVLLHWFVSETRLIDLSDFEGFLESVVLPRLFSVGFSRDDDIQTSFLQFISNTVTPLYLHDDHKNDHDQKPRRGAAFPPACLSQSAQWAAYSLQAKMFTLAEFFISCITADVLQKHITASGLRSSDQASFSGKNSPSLSQQRLKSVRLQAVTSYVNVHALGTRIEYSRYVAEAPFFASFQDPEKNPSCLAICQKWLPSSSVANVNSAFSNHGWPLSVLGKEVSVPLKRTFDALFLAGSHIVPAISGKAFRSSCNLLALAVAQNQVMILRAIWARLEGKNQNAPVVTKKVVKKAAPPAMLTQEVLESLQIAWHCIDLGGKKPLFEISRLQELSALLPEDLLEFLRGRASTRMSKEPDEIASHDVVGTNAPDLKNRPQMKEQKPAYEKGAFEWKQLVLLEDQPEEEKKMICRKPNKKYDLGEGQTDWNDVEVFCEPVDVPIARIKELLELAKAREVADSQSKQMLSLDSLHLDAEELQSEYDRAVSYSVSSFTTSTGAGGPAAEMNATGAPTGVVKKVIYYDLLGVKVDVAMGDYGENNFYQMQLVHEKRKDLYVLFTRWGRVGDEGMFQRTPCADKEAAIKEFLKIAKSKIGYNFAEYNPFGKPPLGFTPNWKKYHLLELTGSGNHEEYDSDPRASKRSLGLLRPFEFMSVRKHSSRVGEQRNGELKAACSRSSVVTHQIHQKYKNKYSYSLSPGVHHFFRSLTSFDLYQYQLSKKLQIRLEDMPISQVSARVLKVAREILKMVAAILHSLKQEKAKGWSAMDQKLIQRYKSELMDWSSEYYRLIPKKRFRADEPILPLSTKMLGEEAETLSELDDFTCALKILFSALHSERASTTDHKHPLEHIVDDLLPVKLTDITPVKNCEQVSVDDLRNSVQAYIRNTSFLGVPAEEPDSEVDKNSAEYKMVMQYLRGTAAQTFSGDKKLHCRIYKVTQTKSMPGDAAFRSFQGERRLLWHGTSMPNVLSILAQNLKVAPAEAPASGYAFGKGVYFADMAEKGLNYSQAMHGAKVLWEENSTKLRSSSVKENSTTSKNNNGSAGEVEDVAMEEVEDPASSSFFEEYDGPPAHAPRVGQEVGEESFASMDDAISQITDALYEQEEMKASTTGSPLSSKMTAASTEKIVDKLASQANAWRRYWNSEKATRQYLFLTEVCVGDSPVKVYNGAAAEAAAVAGDSTTEKVRSMAWAQRLDPSKPFETGCASVECVHGVGRKELDWEDQAGVGLGGQHRHNPISVGTAVTWPRSITTGAASGSGEDKKGEVHELLCSGRVCRKIVKDKNDPVEYEIMQISNSKVVYVTLKETDLTVVHESHILSLDFSKEGGGERVRIPFFHAGNDQTEDSHTDGRGSGAGGNIIRDHVAPRAGLSPPVTYSEYVVYRPHEQVRIRYVVELLR